MGAGETVHFLPLKFKRTEVHSHFIFFFFLEGMLNIKYLLKKEISFFHGHVDACDYLDLFFIFCSHIFENARVCEKDLLFMFNIHMCFPY